MRLLITTVVLMFAFANQIRAGCIASSLEESLKSFAVIFAGEVSEAKTFKTTRGKNGIEMLSLRFRIAVPIKGVKPDQTHITLQYQHLRRDKDTSSVTFWVLFRTSQFVNFFSRI